MLELLPEDVGSLPLEGWRVDAELTAAHGGYTNQSLVLWGPGGVPGPRFIVADGLRDFSCGVYPVRIASDRTVTSAFS